MSELKNLAWTVQEKVETTPFEQLERRGVRRRHRRQALVVTGIAAATAAVLVAVLLPSAGRPRTEQPPVAPGPTPTTVDQPGETVVGATDATIDSISMASPVLWAAAWRSCPNGAACSYAAVLHFNDGGKTVTSARSEPYTTARVGSDVIAIAAPSSERLTRDDPGWESAGFVRANADGMTSSALRYAPPTATWKAGEILTDRIVPGQTVIVNLEDETMRMLEMADYRSPVVDSTGRTWFLSGTGRADVAWTDDNGKHWDSDLLDPDNQSGRVAVSPDGRTVLAASFKTEGKIQVVSTMKMSADRGAHWMTVQNYASSGDAGPVVFDDGTAVVLGARANDSSPRLYRIGDGKATPLASAPTSITGLYGDSKWLYGPQPGGPGGPRVATSTDRGATWRYVAAR
ncbi:sialidase family protein [Kribbella sp. NPDC055071]